MMHLVLHIGAHGTDGGRIARWIADNRTGFEAQGIAVPPPRTFLARISQALDQGRDADPAGREEALLRGLGASGARLRMVVSTPGLLGSVADVMAPEGFYVRDVARRLHGLHVLFGHTRLTIMLAVGNAGTVIPALLPESPEAAEALMSAIPEDALPWARLAATIRRQLPRASLLVWRHEDLARVWPQVLGVTVGPGGVLPPAGLIDFAAADLGAEARVRMQRYVAASPPVNAGQLRDVAAVFGRRFGTKPPAAVTRDLPGWLGDRLAALDAGQPTEWSDLAGIEGVRVLSPLQPDPPAPDPA